MTNGIPERLTQSLADRYRLEREVGVGGMATVYLAHDVRHERDVAVKVLHQDLAAALGPERFLAEIKTTARLQHPHILPLLDSGSADGLLYYVMPFVTGESLRDRLIREQQLPIDDALRIGREVADALEYAHAQTVIHRDIKPENILLQGGHALVTDFGIALAVQSAGRQRMTQTGLSLGTPQYMSPEQAMGEKALDGRADIYALGAVVYEMLTGEPPFTGPNVQAIVAKVMNSEPARPTTLRKTIPPRVEAAVLKALAKLPADRFVTAQRFADALVITDATSGDFAAATPAGRRWRDRAAPVLLAVGLLALGAGAWSWIDARSGARNRVLRYQELLRLGAPQRQESQVAISPDGGMIAYVGTGRQGRTQIQLRPRSELASRTVPGTEGAVSVFFSPDGRQLGFITDNPLQLKIATPGGTVSTVAPLMGGVAGGTGGTWSTDGWIYVGGPGFRTIRRMRPDGSHLEQVTSLDSAAGEWWQGWPEVLPNGQAVLFTVRLRTMEYRIAVADLKEGKHRLLMPGVQARIAPNGELLVLAEDGSLRALPFDDRTLSVKGPAVAIADGVRVRTLAAASLAVSRSGTLLYERNDTTTQAIPSELVWVDRKGNVEPVTPMIRGGLTDAVISPDGGRIAYAERRGRQADVWIRELASGVTRRLTTVGGEHPEWLPDGRSVSYISSAGRGASAVFVQSATGNVPAQLALEDPDPILNGEWSRNGGWFAYRQTRANLEELYAARPGTDSARIVVASTPANECSPVFSPDGRWIAYSSDESGQTEVFVRPFPNVNAGRWQVSIDGGAEPRWDPRGRQLYYVDLKGAVWSATVGGKGTLEVASRMQLFAASDWRADPGVCETRYDVSPRDGRFLLARKLSPAPGASIVFVENFMRDERRRSPR